MFSQSQCNLLPKRYLKQDFKTIKHLKPNSSSNWLKRRKNVEELFVAENTFHYSFFPFISIHLKMYLQRDRFSPLTYALLCSYIWVSFLTPFYLFSSNPVMLILAKWLFNLFGSLLFPDVLKRVRLVRLMCLCSLLEVHFLKRLSYTLITK